MKSHGCNAVRDVTGATMTVCYSHIKSLALCEHKNGHAAAKSVQVPLQEGKTCRQQSETRSMRVQVFPSLADAPTMANGSTAVIATVLLTGGTDTKPGGKAVARAYHWGAGYTESLRRDWKLMRAMES